MKENRKKLLSLLTATTILLSATGCSNSVEKTVDENNNVTYSGEVDLNSLDNIYLIEVNDLKGKNELYITKKNILGGGLYSRIHNQYVILGTDIILIDDINGYECDYGKVLNIVPFEQFISSYTELKENYTAEEIICIFDSVKEDYNELISNDNVKKLELK